MDTLCQRVSSAKGNGTQCGRKEGPFNGLGVNLAAAHN